MSIPCNMTEEERAYWRERFPRWLTDDEELRAKTAFKRYIFYETWGRRGFREYHCWNCGCFEANRGEYGQFHFDPFAYKHGDHGECPNCNMAGEYIALGRYRSMKTLEETQKIGFIWERDGTLLMSAGLGHRRYGLNDLDPLVEYWEKARYAVRPGKRQMWRENNLWEGCEYCGSRMEAANTFSEPFPSAALGNWNYSGEVYWFGVDAIGESEMKYCCVEEFMRERWGVDWDPNTGELESVRGLVLYLGEYSRRPQIEMLYKLGHGDVISALIERGSLDKKVVNWRAKKPSDFFRLSKREYKAFAESRGRYRDLVDYHSRTENTGGMGFEEYCAACAWLPREIDRFFEEAKRNKIPALKLLAYLREQAPIGAKGDDTFGLWMDYLDMAGQLERNMTFQRNLFPKDLPQEHDAAHALLERIAEEQYAAEVGKGPEERYGKRYKRLKRTYAYSDGELQIVIPVNKADIECEGKQLRHCVAGYSDRHIQGKTTILFLRRKAEPERRYVTIEINDASFQIIQAHGYRNDAGDISPRTRHKEFFKEWLEWLRQGSPRTRNGKPIRPKTQEAKTA